jgi:Flp pilus assembly secretin CpaC
MVIPNKFPKIPGQINVGRSSSSLATFSGVRNRRQPDAMIQALEQHAGSDRMSAPKVTGLSRKTAEIVIAMELRYPQSYGHRFLEERTGSSRRSQTRSAGVIIPRGSIKFYDTEYCGRICCHSNHGS